MNLELILTCLLEKKQSFFRKNVVEYLNPTHMLNVLGNNVIGVSEHCTGNPDINVTVFSAVGDSSFPIESSCSEGYFAIFKK